MATKKKVVETTEEAYRGALLKLVSLDFEVKLDDGQNYARVRHPQARQYEDRGEHVSYTKVHFRDFQDRVEVDGKRVAKGEILDRTIHASLVDIENAQKQVAYALQQAGRRHAQYEAMVAAGLDSAAKGMAYAKKYTSVGDRLRLENGDAIITLTQGDSGEERERIVLTISAANGALPALAAALKAARKGLKA
jgi:hypothetical protein